MHQFFAAFIFIGIFLSYGPSNAGYGDAVNGFPSWKERQILVLTNACRMSPAQYRDLYVGSYAILDSSVYPAVPPLYFNAQLNASARGHALDMGDTCGQLQHNSCNGTAWDARIKKFYTASSWIGENIAAGNSDPFNTMNQWIEDNPQGSDKPAADLSWCKTSTKDSSRCDGHRFNIMNKQYKEMGVGYSYGANSNVQYHYFWAQDFGGGASSISNPIVGGAHFFRETGKITFMAEYWDASLKGPSEASVTIAGQKNVLTLAMGAAYRGTYQLALSKGMECRNYFFSFVDGSGKTWRYPETGFLVTTGEGSCANEYSSSTNVESAQINQSIPEITTRISTRISQGAIFVSVPWGMPSPQSSSVLNAQGKMLYQIRWAQHVHETKEGAEVVFKSRTPEGVYFIVHRISGMRCLCEKIAAFK